MAVEFLKSIGLILGTIGALLVGFPGVMTCIVVWVILSGLFLISRFSKRVYFFAEWSWPRFLLTIGSALGIPYLFLLLSPGF
jgi:hypothetical protein